MPRVVTATLEDVRNFLLAELRAVMARRHVSAEVRSMEYLVGLLLTNIASDSFFARDSEGRLQDTVLAQLYLDCLAGDEDTQREKLKRLGDVCMFVTGFFPESLQRKAVGINYYLTMGGTAYEWLSTLHLSQVTRNLFKELSVNFRDFSSVLSEMGERSGFSNNSDLLALYERWLVTGDSRLRDRLVEQGITSPLLVPKKVA